MIGGASFKANRDRTCDTGYLLIGKRFLKLQFEAKTQFSFRGYLDIGVFAKVHFKISGIGAWCKDDVEFERGAVAVKHHINSREDAKPLHAGKMGDVGAPLFGIAAMKIIGHALLLIEWADLG